ncbi:MAG: FAD-dependent oxidoreductase [Gammaproteobacteria bacterium]|nr:FAD-dependent oxidoreductase [Gammaproteobacteria bacterium]
MKGQVTDISPRGMSRRRFLDRLTTLTQALFVTSFTCSARLFAKTVNQLPVEKLKALIEDRVISRTDSNYEVVRQSSVWQMIKPDKFPALIVQARSVNEIIETIRYARESNKKISVRCGGHSYYSSFLQDDMVMLDLSYLQDISVDKKTGAARVQPAARSVDFLERIAEHGFCFPAAHCGNVPLGGFLLGGGLGWNGEAWGGISCFNIREVEVVTAQGELITADASRNADFYWAARGAGPDFFGVVTRFTLDLYKNPAVILTTTLVWDIGEAKTVADWLDKTVRQMPDNVETLLILADNPEQQQSGSDKICIVQASVFADTEEIARTALGPLSGDGIPDGWINKSELVPTPLADLYEWDDTAYPRLRWDVDALWSDDAPGELVGKLVDHVREMPSGKSSILLLWKPYTKELPDAAFSMIGSVYLACYAIWTSPEEDEINNHWVRKTMQLLEPHTKGHYINESNYVAIPSRRVNSFSRTNHRKLKYLALQHDPDNLFHTYIE